MVVVRPTATGLMEAGAPDLPLVGAASRRCHLPGVRGADRRVAAVGRGRERLFCGRSWPPASGAHLEVVAFAPLFSSLLALSVIDLFTYRLPDRITFPVLFVLIAAVVGLSLLPTTRPHDLLGAAVGSLGMYGLLALMWLISPRGMGYGDVKLARILGPSGADQRGPARSGTRHRRAGRGRSASA